MVHQSTPRVFLPTIPHENIKNHDLVFQMIVTLPAEERGWFPTSWFPTSVGRTRYFTWLGGWLRYQTPSTVLRDLT